MTGPIGTFNPNKCRRFDFTAMKNILRAFAFSLLASAAFGQGVLITVQKLNDGSNNLTAPINVGSGTAVHIKSGASLIADAGSTIAGFSGSGSVTSVGLSLPGAFTVSGSPVTTTGTLTAIWANENANLFLAGPSSGSAAAPTFRGIAAADLPLATTGAFGAVKPDGSTITISGGVISASGSGSGTVTSIGPANGSLTFSPNPITSTGTIGLNVANANTWTVPQFINVASQGVTANAGFTIENLTAATSGTQQFSPLLAFRGSGWGTTAPGAQSVVFGWQNQPVQGTMAPTGNFVLYSQINGGSLNNVFQVSDSGVPTFGAAFSAPNGSTATTQTVGDNTTNIATDAFVLANGGGGGGGNAVVVANVAAMEAYSLSGLSTGSGISTLGYYVAGDGGGINCTLNTSSSATSDGVVYFPTSGSGRWIQTFKGAINVKQGGSYGDAISFASSSVSITSTSHTLTVTGASFVSSDVGKSIYIPGAGTTGAPLYTTISAVGSSTSITLTSAAGTTVSSASETVIYGHDDGTQLNAVCSATANVFMPGGNFLTSVTVNFQDTVVSGGATISQLIGSGTASTELIYVGTGNAARNTARGGVLIQGIHFFAPSPSGSTVLLDCFGMVASDIRNNVFEGGNTGIALGLDAISGGATSDCYFVHIHDNSFQNQGTYCIFSQGTPTHALPCNACWVTNNVIHGENTTPAYGIYWIDNAWSNDFSDDDFESGIGIGIYLNGQSNTLFGNYFETSSFGIDVAGGSGGNVICVFRAQGVGSISDSLANDVVINPQQAVFTFPTTQLVATNPIGGSNNDAPVLAESLVNASYTNEASFLSPNLSTGHNAIVNVGVDASNYDLVSLGFGFLGGANSSSNNWTIGFYGVTQNITGFGTGAIQFNSYGAGTATFDSSGNITSVSDARYKNIDGAFDRGLGAVLGLHPTVFHWNKMSGLNQNDVNAGFIAQDVLKSIPEAVGKNKAGYYTLADRPITAALVNAVKELTLFVAGAILLGIANLVLVIRNRKK